MDAPFTLARLSEEFNALCESKDFEGAEEILNCMMGHNPNQVAYFHFLFGRMYCQWNKLTSAIDHLTKAAELTKSSGEEMLLLQVLDELSRAKKQQALQTP